MSETKIRTVAALEFIKSLCGDRERILIVKQDGVIAEIRGHVECSDTGEWITLKTPNCRCHIHLAAAELAKAVFVARSKAEGKMSRHPVAIASLETCLRVSSVLGAVVVFRRKPISGYQIIMRPSRETGDALAGGTRVSYSVEFKSRSGGMLLKVYFPAGGDEPAAAEYERLKAFHGDEVVFSRDSNGA